MSYIDSPSPARGPWQPPGVEAVQAMLPQYEVLALIGRGGMGAVYQARQRSLKRLVAIKILPPGAVDDEMQFVERFQNEAQTLAQMNHPAIVSVHDFGESTEGLLYFIMEFVDGTDVQKLIEASGKLESTQALTIAAHVCEALAYAHKRGVIHRDIKPANILIDPEGQIKVADFGLAKMSDTGMTRGLTRSNVAMGSPDYVAPEVLSPSMQADHRADIYAVGVMLYQMLTGALPRGMFKLPSEKAPGTDRRFDEIICKAMEHDQEDRYQSALEMRQALDAIRTTPPVKSDGTGPKTRRMAIPAPRSRRPVTLLAVAAVFVALGMAGFVAMKKENIPAAAAPQAETNDQGDSKPAARFSASLNSGAPGITDWQDVTEAAREKARGIPGMAVDSDGIRWPGSGIPPRIGLTPPDQKDYAIRVRFTGGAQVDLRVSGDQFLFASCGAKQLVFKRQKSVQGGSEDLIPGVYHPGGYDPSQPHEMLVTMQGTTLQVWLDGRFVGTAQDAMFKDGMAGVRRMNKGALTRIEIAGLTAQPQPAAPDKTDGIQDRAIDLLALVDPRRDALMGDWTRTAEGLAKPGLANPPGKVTPIVQLPYVPPAEYDFEVEFTVSGGSGSVGQIVSAQSRSFSWILSGGSVSQPRLGFELFDTKPTSIPSEVSRDMTAKLENGRRYRSRVEVRTGSLRGYLDGQLMIDWTGSVSRLGRAVAVGDNDHLGLRSSRQVVFHKIEVREVTGTGKVDASLAPIPVHWQDVTETVRTKAAATAGLVLENGAIRTAGSAFTPILPLTPPGQSDYAVRVRYRGEVQVNLRAIEGRGFLFALSQVNQVLFKRYHTAETSAADLRTGVLHPEGFDPDQPHQLTVTMQGPLMRVWLDGTFVGEAQDKTMTLGAAALAFKWRSIVEKVETMVLDQP